MLLRTLFFHCCVYPWTILVILCGVPLSFISPDYLHNCARIWAKGCLFLAGTRVTVEGTEHIPTQTSAVYVANHQSHFDILAMYACLPIQFRWMAKQELFNIPLFGLTMRRSGYIPIDRSNSRKSLQSMIAAARRVNTGTSVVIFPEGTRSTDGRLLPFKQGGFLIATKAKAPLVPVVINGSARILRRGSKRIYPGHIRITVQPAIHTTESSSKDLDSLSTQVKNAIATHLSEVAA